MSEAIVVTGVSKMFRIAHDPVRSLKERLVAINRRKFTDFHALSEMSFSIEQGSTVGILGHNGSGKSTLLKCIAGILRPTTGTIGVRGRIASLLELGAGFHPELTGRENVYINAAFLGISRTEVGRRLEEILDFAELGQFIDEPVKHYSSGMYVRLGFAVAVNVDPEILLIDEVLAVGDEAFAKKCLGRVRQFQAEGRTIVVVTHAADVVRQVCNRALVLDHGHLIADTKPPQAIQIFREHLHGTLVDNSAHQSGPLRIESITSKPTDDGVRLMLTVNADHEMSGVGLSVEVSDSGGRMIYRVDNDQLATPVKFTPGQCQFEIGLSAIGLLPGEFPITVRLTELANSRLLDWYDVKPGIVSAHARAGDGVTDLRAVLRQKPSVHKAAPQKAISKKAGPKKTTPKKTAPKKATKQKATRR